MKKKEHSRRKFITNVALGAAGVFAPAGMMAKGGASGIQRAITSGPELSLSKQAPDGKPLKAGLIGCGGRGTGAAINFLDAGPSLEIVALGDLFEDQVNRCRTSLKTARNIEVKDEHCFSGFDSYLKVIDSDIDLVLLATPPHFRPEHVKAAVEAGKHIFQEKPVAVDPSGARLMVENTKKAKEKKLCMVSGTIRRYQKDYIETQKRVQNGDIGEVIGANIIRNGGARWWVQRREEWTDMEYMIRNWGNFNWLSGDEIVEKLVHEIDVMSWHVGSNPLTAVGYGSNLQRVVGDQFDQFSIEYDYGNGKKVNCAIRTVNGCDNGKTELIRGTKGYASADGSLYTYDNEVIWEYPYPDEDEADSQWEVNNPFVQEHVELVTAIRAGNYLNDSDEQIKSTRIAIMGRMAAYTGRNISWEEVVSSEIRLGPEQYELGEVAGIPETSPVKGTAPQPSNRFQ
jgi:myo-inositol 2-dehydrogenase / D-chiro-inositol 1-dehydrogenase